MFLEKEIPPPSVTWLLSKTSECCRCWMWCELHFHSHQLQILPTNKIYPNVKRHSTRAIHEYLSNHAIVYSCIKGEETPIPVAVNPLTPNDLYMSRTAPLTSKHCILYIYSTNIGTEYFKHALYSPFFFSLQNAVCFIMLTCLVPVLFTFYIQDVLKLKKK